MVVPDEWPDTIDPHHCEHLMASGVTPTMAALRGYKTVHISRPRYDDSQTKHVLTGDDKLAIDFGFSRNQRHRMACAPTLLTPALDKRGEVWGAQARPDYPYNYGDPVQEPAPKYITPYGQQMHIDVPPGVGPWLDDPEFPLWITEGAKKADCGHWHADLCVVALLGVYGWRGKNDDGGLTTLPDWEEIALNRDVVICFDSDVAYKPEVRQAMTRLARWLKWRRATVYVCWLPRSQNKVGLDDYLMGGHTADDLWRLVKPFNHKSLFWFHDDWKPKGTNTFALPDTTGMPDKLAAVLKRRALRGAEEHR